MDKQVRITVEAKDHPALRKLARALISIAKRQLEQEAKSSSSEAA